MYEAIATPLELAKKELVKQGINVQPIHGAFDRIVAQISGRMPMEVNMLCHFAYDLGTRRMKYRTGRFDLYMRIDGKVLNEAMRQMGGTKEYSTFISQLETNENSLLTILSRLMDRAIVEEITVLMTLHDIGDALQEMSV